MAEKQTGIKLNVSAVNTTGRVFKNIASSAVSVTKNIAKWGSVAVGAALGGFAVAVNKLGELSDVAQSAGTTTDEITKLSGALKGLGVKASSPEALAAAFQRMTKATGLVGVEGFHRIVEQISKLPNAQERATAAVKVFGKTGQQFMPIIEGAAKNGIQALKDVEAGMPGISQAAADACDAAADAISILWDGIKSAFAEGLGEISDSIDSNFQGGVREAAMVGAAHLKYFARVGIRYAVTFFSNFRQVASETFKWFGKIIGNLMKMLGGLIVTPVENAASHVKSVLKDIAAGAAAVKARLSGDRERERAILHERWRESKQEDKAREQNWKEYKRLMDQLDWQYTGVMAQVDVSDLQADREAQVAAARKTAREWVNAAVKVGLGGLDEPNAGQTTRKRADNTNPEAIMGGSYKALTYALRQGYASGIAEVKNLLKKAVDGINGVKAATEDVAENLDFSSM